MGADSSKSAAAGSSNGSDNSVIRRHPPISTRSQSVPSGSGGLGGDDVLDDTGVHFCIQSKLRFIVDF